MSAGGLVLVSLLSLPLLAGALLAPAGRRAGRLAPIVGVGVALVTLALAVLAAVLQPSVEAAFLAGIPAGFAVDGLSAVLVVTVAGAAVAVLVFAAGDLGGDEAQARFFGLMLLFVGAMLVTVTATSLAVLLMGWEAMGATSYALIGFWWREERRVRAASTAFLTTRAADLGLYLAAGAALAGGVGTLELARLPAAAAPWQGIVVGGVIVAAFGKSAQLPFSFWLSRAMEGPSPVSALLHSATMVAAGGYLLLRVEPLLAESSWAGSLVAWTGVTTAIALGLVALAQSDLKQLLAASTCAQLGFVVLAAGVDGVTAGTSQLVAHAATKSLLFLAAGAWLTALGTKQLEGLRGAARAYPAVGATFAVGALALAGFPPLALWLTKDDVLAVAKASSSPLYVAALVASVAAAAYSGKALALVLRPARTETPHLYDFERDGTRSVPGLAKVPLAVLAACAAFLGLLALPPVSTALARALDVTDEPGPDPWELLLTGAIAIATVLAMWQLAGRRDLVPARLGSASTGWLGLEPAAHAVVVRPTLALARAAAQFDDHVLSRGMRASAQGGRTLAHAAAADVEAPLTAAVGAVAQAFRSLGALARRPQTGQLHQYYAQAAVGLAVLALLAVVLLVIR